MVDRIRRRTFLGGMTATLPLAAVGRARGQAATEELDAAIEQSRSYLLSASTGEELTHWDTPVEYAEAGDLRYTVYYALLLERLGVRAELRERCLSYLFAQQSAEGGWGDAVTNYGVLLLLDLVDESYPERRRQIEAEIEADGHSLSTTAGEGTDGGAGGDGEEGTRVSERFRVRLLYAVLDEESSYSELFPDDEPLELGRLLATTPAFEGRTISAHESITRPVYIGPLSAYALLGAAAREEPLDEDDQLLMEALETLLLSRRLTNGAWNTSTTTIFAALALAERGYDTTDAELQYPVDWIADNRVTEAGAVEIWRLPVWDTAHTVDALLASGSSSSEPVMQEAAQWLMEARTSQLDVGAETVLDREPAPFRDNYGAGWGFIPDVFSDWEDTAIVIDTLSAFPEMELDDQLAFLLDIQNRDGSWSAYTTDYHGFDTDEIAEEVRSALGDGLYHLFFGYIQCPDVTGKALVTLGNHGYTVDNSRAVRTAVDYLRRSTADNGLWLGVWGQGYAYGTARVLKGLRAVTGGTDHEFVTTAVEALLGHQNDDGGWGEDSKYDPASATPGNVEYQRAESNPTQTAWTVQALLAGGLPPDHEAVDAAIDYLLDSQQADGSWPVDRVLHNIGGPNYSTDATTQAAVLKTLGEYRSRLLASQM